MVLIFLDVDIDDTLRRYYRRCIDVLGDTSTHRALIIDIFLIVLIIDGINISTIGIMSMSMSQNSTSMSLSTGDDDIVDNVSMADS
jgi:hypothetical protein